MIKFDQKNMIQRVYIDTSVIGGCFDKEFNEWSNKLIEEVLNGRKIAVFSDITIDEIEDAPERVKNKLKELLDYNPELVAADSETNNLAKNYILEGAITEKYFEDAQHIAIATIFKVDVLVSWNFKHIVNLDRIRLFNSVNLKNGYSILEIRTPREILREDKI
ncbi:MAG: PIN domain protein [Candidatus Dojkabacteria bacterium]